MRKVITFNAKRCSGCRACEIVCAMRHRGGCSRDGSRLRLISDDKNMVHQALFCRHCKKPVCRDLCPVDAIVRDEETGVVRVVAEACIGCGLCLDCPLGAMILDPDTGLAAMCDLCDGDPACVKLCVQGALRYVGQAKPRETVVVAHV